MSPRVELIQILNARCAQLIRTGHQPPTLQRRVEDIDIRVEVARDTLGDTAREIAKLLAMFEED